MQVPLRCTILSVIHCYPPDAAQQAGAVEERYALQEAADAIDASVGGRGGPLQMGSRQTVERYARALAENDLDAQDALVHEDYVGHWPQSGEVVRGRVNRRAILESYPGASSGIRPSTDRIIGQDDKFITGPSWNIIHLTGSGDELTATGTITYPNGETWHFASLLTLREGKIWRQVDYFAPPFEAPAWRAPFVELEPERGSG